MTKLSTVIALVILLTGVVTFSHRYGWRSRTQPQLKMGFTIEYSLTDNGRLYATSVRYVKSNGEFLEDTNYLNPDGSSARHAKLAGTIEHGAVAIDNTNQKLKQVGRAALVHDVTEAEIKAVGYDREDSLLGYKVIVQRRCAADQKQQQHCTEFWLAPSLGGTTLKFEVIDPDGTRRTQEATKVTLGEPSFVVPNYPLDTSIQDRLQQMRQARSTQSP